MTTSNGNRIYTTDSNGIFLYDLAEIGYTSGETVEVKVTEPYNNEFKDHSYVVEGVSNTENIDLTLRTEALSVVGYTNRSIIHSVGNEPITRDNPLDVSDSKDLLKGYETSGSDDDNMLYGYMDKDGNWYIQNFDASGNTVKYARGSSNFNGNWNNRQNLTYSFFNEDL